MVNPAVRLVDGLGGRAATAARFGVSIEAIRLWLKNGIPADRALEVEEEGRKARIQVTANDVLHYARSQREAA